MDIRLFVKSLSAATVVALILAGCGRPEPVIQSEAPPPNTPHKSEPVVEIPTEAPTATPPEAPVPEPLLALPPTPLLTQSGHDLLLEFETGGRSGYNPHPEWPGQASGVTIGIGYDLRFYSRDVILEDWSALPERNLIATAQGLGGAAAREKVRELDFIIVSWQLANDVFDNVDVAREFAHAHTALPQFEELRPNAQAALISLGFNRGWGMSGPNRAEMRQVRDLVPQKDYAGMAGAIRAMKRVWRGTSIQNGMYRRREAEARLMETP